MEHASGGVHRAASATAVNHTPQQIIDSLGLATAIDAEAMERRRAAFNGVHMGTRDLTIGALIDLIRSDAALSPPRTGHIGNWGNIAVGRAGAQDFNKAICAPGYGHPLLYCFNQTEAEAPRAGDWGYVPGSLVERDERKPLRLFAWNGMAFAPVSHARPLFTPFVQADIDGELRPLIEVHRERLRRITQFSFRLEQAVFAQHEDKVRLILGVLIEAAARRDNHHRALQDLVSHATTPGGILTRTPLVKEGKGYRLGGCQYATTEVLVEHALVPFRAVASPRAVFANIASLPPQLPVISNLLTAILSAVLLTHYPDLPASEASSVAPFVTHLHWGGRDMAGYPPLHSGYLFEDAKVRAMRRICATLVAQFQDVPPVFFVLLPAAVFMLCPASVHERDAEALATLFRRVREIKAPPGAAGSRDMQREVAAATRDWHDAHGSALSSYFRSRFGPRHGGVIPLDTPEASEPVEPGGFRDLTLRQASMITGALYGIEAARGGAA